MTVFKVPIFFPNQKQKIQNFHPVSGVDSLQRFHCIIIAPYQQQKRERKKNKKRKKNRTDQYFSVFPIFSHTHTPVFSQCIIDGIRLNEIERNGIWQAETDTKVKTGNLWSFHKQTDQL